MRPRTTSSLTLVSTAVFGFVLSCAGVAAADDLKLKRVIDERLEWWKTNPLGKPYYHDVTPDTVTPPPSGSGKAMALCIGLNFVDPRAYGGWDGRLSGCINDAKAMEQIARSRGFAVTRMIDNQATREALREYLLDAATKLKSGDVLMISYSGHGSQFRDSNGDEDDRMDETWCLYDGQVIDDEVGILWTKFAPGVRIVVFSDSCHSGTVTKDLPRLDERVDRSTRALQSNQSGLPDDQLTILRQRRAARVQDPFGQTVARNTPHAFRSMPDRVMEQLNNDPKQRAFFEAVNARFSKADLDDSKIQATVLLISGCQDNQTSADGSANGLFTGTLIAVWKNGDFSGSYRELHEAVHRRMPPIQKPNLFLIGRDREKLPNERAFQK